MFKCLAAIILYNPCIPQLARNLKPIEKKVEQLYFFDNASHNDIEIADFVKTIPNALYFRSCENQGLSKPFNKLLNFAREHNFSHLLLFDQDSEPALNFMEEMKKHADDNYTCVVPLLKHKSEDYQKVMGATPRGNVEIVNEAINSGTLINLNLLPPNIQFDENLFIDWIDIDFYYLLQKRQLKVLRVNTTHLLVDIGHQKVHHVLKYTWFSSGYSAFRLKKQAQDTIYFKRKNWDHPFLKGHLTFVRWRWLMMLFFEKHKLKKLFALITGTLRGYKLCKKLNLK